MDKPLNVSVAEALGCKPVYETYKISPNTQYERTEGPLWRCLCPPPEETQDAAWDVERVPAKPRHIHRGSGASLEVARYDVSWFAMGPVIERLGINFTQIDGGLSGEADWMASLDRHFGGTSVCGEGHGHLAAACALILALEVAESE